MDLEEIKKLEQYGKMDMALEQLNTYKSTINLFSTPLELMANRMLVCRGRYDQASEVSNKIKNMVGNDGDLQDDLERINYKILSLLFQDKLEIANTNIRKCREGLNRLIIEGKEITMELRSWLNYNEGLYNEKTGKFEEAITYFLLAEKDWISTNYNYYLSVLYGHLGKSFEMKGEFNEALVYYQKEMEIAFDIEEGHRISRSIHNIAGFLWKNGKLEEALNYYQRGLEIEQKVGIDMYYGELLFNMIMVGLDINPKNFPAELIQLLEIHIEKNNRDEDKIRFLIINAMELKSKQRMKDSGKAHEILTSIISPDQSIDLNFDLYVIASITLIELLLEELKFYSNPDVLNEIKGLLETLNTMSTGQKSYLILLDTMILQAKLNLVEGNLKHSHTILDEAKSIAKQHHLRIYLEKINLEHDNLKQELNKWKSLLASNATLDQRLEATKIEQYLKKVLKMRDLVG